MRRFFSCTFIRSGSQSFFAVIFLYLYQASSRHLGSGSGYCSGCLFRYCLSISAVFGCSWYIPFACPFVPVMLILPFCASIWFLCTFFSSWGSAAVSVIIVNMVAVFVLELFIIFCTCVVVGIIGIGRLTFIFGLSYGIWLHWQKVSYSCMSRYL